MNCKGAHCRRIIMSPGPIRDNATVAESASDKICVVVVVVIVVVVVVEI